MDITGVVHKINIDIGRERAMVIEEYIKLHLQPKPWWLPHWTWTRIIKRLLVLELFEVYVPPKEVKDELDK